MKLKKLTKGIIAACVVAFIALMAQSFVSVEQSSSAANDNFRILEKTIDSCKKSSCNCLGYWGYKHSNGTYEGKCQNTDFRGHICGHGPKEHGLPEWRPNSSVGYINLHEWVDLGVSVKWATCNIGSNTPTAPGAYFAWGEISTKSRFLWSNYFDGTYDSDETRIYGNDGQTQITPTSGHDAARENWGGTWRLPTAEEFEELINKCEWKWSKKKGMHGYIVKGPNGNSIFLPAAGMRFTGKTIDGIEITSVDDLGERGYYWCSTLRSSKDALCLFFSKYNLWCDKSHNRSDGFTLRAVTE